MARNLNDSAAHLALCETIDNTAARIGATFHKPAPVRRARRVNRAPAAGMLAAFIIPALCVAAFLVQL